jgi:hypothetical protein
MRQLAKLNMWQRIRMVTGLSKTDAFFRPDR